LCGERGTDRRLRALLSPTARESRRAIATLLQKQFDTRNPLPYITQTDGGGAVAAVLASGFRDDLEERSSLLRGRGGWFLSSRAFGCFELLARTNMRFGF
jgi:hypothetical protein